MLYMSKSKYRNAVQCPKMLWLLQNKPELFDQSVLNQSVLEQGNEVGDLAMGLLGDFVEVPFDRDLHKMLEKTKELMAAGTPIIAEASFSYQGLFCSVDILRNNGNKHVEIVEVKSSTKMEDIYYDDVAFQCYVLSRLGYIIDRAFLAHLDNTYVRHGDLEIDKLFRLNDITDQVLVNQPVVEKNLRYFEQYLQQAGEPDSCIGTHCFSPYLCGFCGYCTRDLPRPNVFDVRGLRKTKMQECYDKGIVSFADLEAKKVLKGKQLLQVQHELHDLPAQIDRQGIQRFLDTVTFPLYFLDFESYQAAIPPFDNTSPYNQIVFQYSLHYMETEDGELKHKEFLAQPGADPRRALAERLCEDIPMDACTMVYNRTFEQTRLKELAGMYPDLAEHLMNIHGHIIDLEIPFKERHYYIRAMQGSSSIKYVLPALFPDDPELDYHNLEGVHKGTEASAAFVQMAGLAPEKQQIIRDQLLKYCGLDTLAMVKVWGKLVTITKESR